MKKILFVCTGNTCRSPMAEYIMNEMLAENGLSDEYCAFSAGISTIDGLGASMGSINACRRMGLDLSSHKSTMVTDRLINDSDIILAMGSSHKTALAGYYGECKDRLFTLGEYASMCDGNVAARDIMDPYMMSDEVYMKVCDEIAAYLNVIINYLKGMKNEDSNRKRPRRI